LDNDAPENIGQLCRSCKMEMDGRADMLRAQAQRAGRSQPLRGVTKKCAGCGEEFYVKSSHALRRKYCSRACLPKRDLKLKARSRAARHVRGWSVKTKGESYCRNCGSASRLHLHHIIPRGKWKAGRADLRNGMTLCSACHLGWHRRDVELSLSLLREDELEFLLTADIGQNVRLWLERNYHGEDSGAPDCIVCNGHGCEFCKAVAA
jgi:hypothetical protein